MCEYVEFAAHLASGPARWLSDRHRSIMTGDAMARTSLVLGIAAEASTVSALLAAPDGQVLGTGRAAGANPSAHSMDLIADRLATAVTGALDGTDPGRLAGAVLGIAGYSRLAGPDALRGTWDRLGVRCPVRVVANPVVAFASATSARCGAVLIAGTGTIAAWIADGEVRHRIDGHGWLVGDDGSGFWLGRQAVRAVLAELDGRGEPTLLRAAVLGTVIGDRVPSSTADQLALLRDAVYTQPPIALRRFAGLVPAAAEAGDRVAKRIVDRSVRLLVDTFAAVADEIPTAAAAPHRAGPPGGSSGGSSGGSAAAAGDGAAPIVLAGQLLVTPGPIRAEVSRRIAARYGRVPVVAGSSAGGAAWLALSEIAPAMSASAHAHLGALRA
jgi:glucosamine kinase